MHTSLHPTDPEEHRLNPTPDKELQGAEAAKATGVLKSTLRVHVEYQSAADLVSRICGPKSFNPIGEFCPDWAMHTLPTPSVCRKILALFNLNLGEESCSVSGMNLWRRELLEVIKLAWLFKRRAQIEICLAPFQGVVPQRF